MIITVGFCLENSHSVQPSPERATVAGATLPRKSHSVQPSPERATVAGATLPRKSHCGWCNPPQKFDLGI